MILADKIIELRKKSGISQEELAEKMNVSRQSVSKWEGAQSVPDLSKILALSEIFGVSTDYLLKDDIETEQYVDEKDSAPMHKVSLEEANRFLKLNEESASKCALGTALCIISPIVLIFLAAISEFRPDFFGGFVISENLAGGVGIAALLTIISIAVVIFISNGQKLKDFEYLEKDEIDTGYGVSGMVKERQAAYYSKHTKNFISGIVICILSVIPLFLSAIIDDDFTAIMGLILLMVICSVGCYILVKTSVINDGFNMLLEKDDYTREKKSDKKKRRDIMVIYWLVVTAVYIAYIFYKKSHFIGYDFQDSIKYGTVIIWATAGVLCPVVSKIVKMIRK